MKSISRDIEIASPSVVDPRMSKALELLTITGGIKDPLRFASLALLDFGYGFRSIEHEDLLKKFDTLCQSNPFHEHSRELFNRFLLQYTHNRLLKTYEEYDKELQEIKKEAGRKLKSVNYGCSYSIVERTLTLRFMDSRKESTFELEINGDPIFLNVQDSVRPFRWMLNSFEIRLLGEESRLFRAITNDRLDDMLFHRAYFEFYKIKKVKRKGYSQSDSLIDANEMYRYYDQNSGEWDAGFEKILGRYKAWIKRDLPVLIRILRE